MAKFELPIYDAMTGEVAKTYTRNFMPVSLYIRFQDYAEKVGVDKVMSDKEMFNDLEKLFLETFPQMTKEEYRNQTDIAEVLLMWKAILDKSTDIAEGDSKNG